MLTRQRLLDGSLHAAMRAVLGPGTPLMSDEARAESIRAMLARAPDPARIWVFGFGSLIWNPAIEFAERRTARVHGYHRDFCLWVRAGRGSPQRPGLMLSLERGGSCTGVVYRIARRAVATELDVLWRREMITMAYHPVWTVARTPKGPVPAIAFAANRGHERYAPDLDDETVARHLAAAEGILGRGCDYLFDTVDHLDALGIADRRLRALARRVRELREDPR